MAKKTNPTTSEKKQAIKPLTYMEARADFFIREKSNNNGFEERIADDLWQWLTDDPEGQKATSIYRFFLKYGIPQKSWSDICARNEYARAAAEGARLLFGTRKEQLALNNEINIPTAHRTLYQYHPDWEQAANDEHNRKKELKLLEAKEPERPTFVFVEREVKETEIVTKAIEDGNRQSE